MPQFGYREMSHRTLLPGRTYRFLYPSINFNCLISGLEERRILVERVRDTESEQLDEETLNSNPFIKRGRWLVTGLDLDKNEERSFYVESMVAVMEITNQSQEGCRCENGEAAPPSLDSVEEFHDFTQLEPPCVTNFHRRQVTFGHEVIDR
jgi:hypothetical protein